jgi:hypothetical protein
MARKLKRVRDSERGTAPHDDGDDGDAMLERRNYLRLAAAAAATVAAAGRTAAAAATGREPDETDRWLLIRGGEGVSRYELTVGGTLRPGDDGDDVRISGSSVEGVVGDEARRYRFDGEIRDLAVDGDAEVRVGTER